VQKIRSIHAFENVKRHGKGLTVTSKIFTLQRYLIFTSKLVLKSFSSAIFLVSKRWLENFSSDTFKICQFSKYELLHCKSFVLLGKMVNRQKIRRMLKENGYSEKVIEEIIKWYISNNFHKGY